MTKLNVLKQVLHIGVFIIHLPTDIICLIFVFLICLVRSCLGMKRLSEQGMERLPILGLYIKWKDWLFWKIEFIGEKD